jgi:hypothetical protein
MIEAGTDLDFQAIREAVSREMEELALRDRHRPHSQPSNLQLDPLSSTHDNNEQPHQCLEIARISHVNPSNKHRANPRKRAAESAAHPRVSNAGIKRTRYQ